MAWLTISTFSAGWGIGGSGFCQYRLDGCGNLNLAFSLQSPGTLLDNTTIFTLPSGFYSVTKNPRIPVYSHTTGGESAAIVITTSGQVQVLGIGGTATTRIDVATVIPI